MKIVGPIVFVLFSFSAFGCAANPQPSASLSYWDLPTTRVLPENEEDRQAECNRISHQRQQVRSNLKAARMSLAGPMQMLVEENNAIKEYAALKERTSEVGCTSAISSK